MARGDLAELCGTEECQLGRTTRAYTLPNRAPAIDLQDALDEFEEARADFAEHPEAFHDSEALQMMVTLGHKAAAIYAVHFIPVVSLTRMSKLERRVLPKLLDMFPDSLLLRGGAVGIPEPPIIADDDDAPIDKDGINLWVKHKPSGEDFCDWNKAGKLKLAAYWGHLQDVPAVVPS